MTNHASHNHPATPGARRTCRAAHTTAVTKLRAAFMAAAADNDSELIREYEAMVYMFSVDWDMDLHAAYDLIEKG